jgi:hypothetical protein
MSEDAQEARTAHDLPCARSVDVDTVASPVASTSRISRRAFVRGSGGVSLGVAAVWSAPSIRTAAVALGAAGTPPPPTNPPKSQVETTDTPVQIDFPGGEGTGTDGAPDPGGGTLPITGIDPKPLLIAGGATIATGGALLAISQDPEPNRAED